MDEHSWAEQFERELNVLMGRGKKSFRQNYPRQLEPALLAAKLCLTTDFEPESQVRAKLLSKLLAKMSREDADSAADRGGNFGEELDPGWNGTDQELDELNLSEVVGGVAGPSAAGCAICGCNRAASSFQEERCPECGHARSLHR
ncbi:hypothetical protein JCM15765_38840 [Paradesulfitobacterium aromaticivorans]